MKEMIRKIMHMFLVFSLLLSHIVIDQLHVRAEEETYTFEEITSEDQIIPGMRYIITAEFTSELQGDLGTSYVKILSSSTSPYGKYGYREGYDVSKNADGTITITNNSLYLKLRLEDYDTSLNRYRLSVGNGKYLYGFCNTSYAAYAGRECCTLMPINSYSSYGESWWQLKSQESGDWLISTQVTRSGHTGVELMSYRHQLSGIVGFSARQVDGVNSVDDIGATQTNIHLYREICSHPSSEVTHHVGNDATCSNVGTVDSYYCANCNLWATDSNFNHLVAYENTFLPSLGHDFSNGACSSCALEVASDTYELFDEYSFNSSLNGEKIIVVSKHGDQYYAMGHQSVDGKRNAVKVTVTDNGKIVASNEAEILTFDYDGYSSYYTADGGEFVIYNGKLMIMPKERQLSRLNRISFDIPSEEEFGKISVYDYSMKGNYYMALVQDSVDGTLYFTTTTEKNETTAVNMYVSTCKHLGVIKQPYVKATCTQQGTQAYDYCGKCGFYYLEGDYTNPIYTIDEFYEFGNPFSIDATGHKFENDICINCGLHTPVYKKLTSQAEFDSLGDDAYYIFAVELDGVMYALEMPRENPYLIDENNNYMYDIFEEDLNNNGHIDGYEIDLDVNGVYDYLEDFDGDGIVDEWDRYAIEEYLINSFYDDLQTNNTVIATVNEDGTLSVKDKNAFEFQVEYIPNGKMESNRNYAFLIPNYMVSSRIQHMFRNMLGLFGRTYGDVVGEGIIIEYGNWEVNFDDGETDEGMTGVSLTMGTGYNPLPGQEVRLRVITNDTTGEKEFYFIMGDYEEELVYELPEVPEGHTETILPVYLYGSEAIYDPIHEHSYGNWTEAITKGKHYKECACGDQIIENCSWKEQDTVKNPENSLEYLRTYQCEVCLATENKVLVSTDEIENVSTETKIKVAENSTAVLFQDTELVVEMVDIELTEDLKEKLKNIGGKDTEPVLTFDISLLVNGVKTQPGGLVEVTTPLPESMKNYTYVQVVYIDDLGNVTLHNSKVNEDGTITFTTDHFSCFAVMATPKEKAPLLGDVNEDGFVNNKDRMFLTRYLAKWSEYPEGSIHSLAADVDQNGQINNKDRMILTRHLAKWSGYDALPYNQ